MKSNIPKKNVFCCQEGKDKWILNSITIFNSIPSSYISKIINIGLIFIVFKLTVTIKAFDFIQEKFLEFISEYHSPSTFPLYILHRLPSMFLSIVLSISCIMMITTNLPP
ncbi:hypothetical protein U3516DRAFT_753708 [Neocallimastix sp. 'constans']